MFLSPIGKSLHLFIDFSTDKYPTFVGNQLQKKRVSPGQNVQKRSINYYFSFADAELKSKGLKIAVVFVHERFQFEVWVSGMNRKHQAEYFELLKEKSPSFELTDDPVRKDYILRVPLDPAVDIFHGHALPEQIETTARDVLTFLDTL